MSVPPLKHFRFRPDTSKTRSTSRSNPALMLPLCMASSQTRLSASWRDTATLTQTLPTFQALKGPQTRAIQSKADELLYGGAAGGGKTGLLIGLAYAQHQKAIIFRREYPQLSEIHDTLDDWLEDAETNRQRHRWTYAKGRFVELGAVKQERDWTKYKGRPHDFVGFDELSEFTQTQYRTLIVWNRTNDPKQRCRVVCTSNPPLTEDEAWIIDEWAPWLDPEFADPAEPGELRWYLYSKGTILWYRSADPVEVDGETRRPRSRTFIPARITDNPYLLETGYGSQLDALPDEIREAFKYGVFSRSNLAHPFQVIPREWVVAAQNRWRQTRRPDRLTHIGVDPARGGKDRTVLAMRYGNYIDRIQSHAGKTTPDGSSVGTHVVNAHKDNAAVIVDVIGIGASVYDYLKEILPAYDFNASKATTMRDRSKRLRMKNMRSASYWHLRELLDPNNGHDICLPPEASVQRELCAPRWSLRHSGIIDVEPKEDVKKRLGGKSPDEADAIAYAFADILLGTDTSYSMDLPI